MKLHAEKTSRGWEIADETNTFEDESLSVVYPTKKAAEVAIKNCQQNSFDELAVLERMHD